MTFTLTFALSVIYWSTSLLSLRVLATSIAFIKLFSTKGPGDLDFCLQDQLLVRNNISTKFEGPNHKHCRIISFFGTKVTVTLTFDLKVTYSYETNRKDMLAVLYFQLL